MQASKKIESYPHQSLAQWDPAFPAGRIDRLYLHWSAGNYSDVFPAYHFCIAYDAKTVTVVNTHRIEANMRDLRLDPDAEYAAHTRGRNSFALGLSIMGMQAARPDDFGPYPLTEPLIAGLCRVAARLASFYAIPVDEAHVLTHAEAAVADGYFGTGQDERWDIARLAAGPRPLLSADARIAGTELRDRILAV